MKKITYILLSVTIFGMIYYYAISHAPSNTDWLQYDYRDTRKLVDILDRASNLIKKSGTSAFKQFTADEEDWTYRDAYIYVYREDGICLFNAHFPELVGQNLSELSDPTGVKILQGAFAAARDDTNPHGWYHYWWRRHNRFPPVWKASCNKMVQTPEGENLLVGIGMPDLPHERAFVKMHVNNAIKLINEHGADGIELIKQMQQALPRDVSPIFIFTQDGEVLISYSFKTKDDNNILEYTDDAGHYPIKQALEKLEEKESAWIVFLTNSRESMNMQKNALYVKKVRLNGKNIYVASMTKLPKPSWIK